MLINYKECLNLYKTDYMIKKNIKEKKLFKVENGIYSTTNDSSFFDIFCFKYPQVIFTMESAFYYHGLTDVIPEKISIITSKDSYKIKDSRIKQYYIMNEYLGYGKETMQVHNHEICIYSKERLLIELIRYKNKLPFDYYKEIIESYRKIIHSLDIEWIEDLSIALPKSQMVMRTIQMEVF